jgi:hypothetical protein
MLLANSRARMTARHRMRLLASGIVRTRRTARLSFGAPRPARVGDWGTETTRHGAERP